VTPLLDRRVSTGVHSIPNAFFFPASAEIMNQSAIDVPHGSVRDIGSAADEAETICTPVDKNGEGILDPATHLTCYEVHVDSISSIDESPIRMRLSR
jgi:hypothetical protein